MLPHLRRHFRNQRQRGCVWMAPAAPFHDFHDYHAFHAIIYRRHRHHVDYFSNIPSSLPPRLRQRARVRCSHTSCARVRRAPLCYAGAASHFHGAFSVTFMAAARRRAARSSVLPIDAARRDQDMCARRQRYAARQRTQLARARAIDYKAAACKSHRATRIAYAQRHRFCFSCWIIITRRLRVYSQPHDAAYAPARA